MSYVLCIWAMLSQVKKMFNINTVSIYIFLDTGLSLKIIKNIIHI